MKIIQILTLVIVLINLSFCSYSAYSTSLAYDLVQIESVTFHTEPTIKAWNCTRCKNYNVENR